MRRRNFIITAASTAVATSGCLGYRVESVEENDRQKRRLTSYQKTQEKQATTISNLKTEQKRNEETITDLQTENEQLAQTATARRRENNDLEQQLSDLESSTLEELIQLSGTTYSNGVSDWEDGRTSWENENYGTASMYFFRAEGMWVDTWEVWDTARERATQSGNSQVVDALESNQAFITDMQDAANNYANAAYWESYDDTAEADNYFQDGESAYDAAQTHEFTSESELLDLTDSSTSARSR